MALGKPARPPFEAIHRHGFVRVAAASPTGSSGDVAFNTDQAIALAKEADGEGCDLLVYPELNLSSYAVDDLFLQEAFLDAVEDGIARFREATAKLGAGLRRRSAAAAQRPALQLRSGRRAGAGSSGWCRRASCPITANITRNAGSSPASA